MAWTTLTNLAAGGTVLENHMDDIRTNIEHVGGMKAWDNLLSALAQGDEQVGKIGTYTGNGSATQAITGVGFQPKALFIHRQVDSAGTVYTGRRTSSDTATQLDSIGYKGDHIISLDASGFTVGDGTGDANRFNVSGSTYTYLALGSG